MTRGRVTVYPSEATRADSAPWTGSSGALPAWAPAPGKFGAASTNVPNDINPDPSNTAIYRDQDGMAGMWVAWNGGAFASIGAYGSMLVFGGGNNSYSGNGIARFNADSRVWSMQSSPALSSTYVTNGGDPNNVGSDGGWAAPPGAVGTPFPGHTYSFLCWVPQSCIPGSGALGSLVFMCHWQNNTNNNITTTQLWSHDLSAGTWAKAQIASWSMWVNYGGIAGYDAARNGIWIIMPLTQTGAKRLHFVAWSSKTSATRTEIALSGTGSDGGGAFPGLFMVTPEFLPTRNCIVLPIDGAAREVVCVDLSSTVIGSNNNASAFKVTQSGTSCPSMWDDAGLSSGGAGAALGRFAACSYDNALWTLDQYTSSCVLYKLAPPAGALTGTWTWTNQTLTANAGETFALRANTAATVVDKMLFGRFAYAPALKSFLLTDAHDLPAQALRPAAFT